MRCSLPAKLDAPSCSALIWSEGTKGTKGHAQRYASLASRMLVLSSFLKPQNNRSSLNAEMQAATTLSDHHLEDVEAHRNVRAFWHSYAQFDFRRFNFRLADIS